MIIYISQGLELRTGEEEYLVEFYNVRVMSFHSKNPEAGGDIGTSGTTSHHTEPEFGYPHLPTL